jgi:hypothetical protein
MAYCSYVLCLKMGMVAVLMKHHADIMCHHHQITKLSHSINAIGPAPHRSGRKREHRSIMCVMPHDDHD